MSAEIISAVTLPFLGTCIGAGFVLFMKGEMNRTLQRSLTGFAAGVMVAASIWSLILPAIDRSEHLGKLAFLPAFIGVWAGFGFLLLLDHVIPHLHQGSESPEGTPSTLGKNTMLVLAVALHNLPEGMAVGVALAGAEVDGSLAEALLLSLGIAIQNLPEGAIISTPLTGRKKLRAFCLGTASGIVEPLGALLTLWLTAFLSPALPFVLAFAAGAMVYVVFEELAAEIHSGPHSFHGTIGMALGFTLMMVLDAALG